MEKDIIQSSQNDLNGFQKVCKVNDLFEKVGKRFIINDAEVAVFKVEGKIYALSNICPHQHTPLIYDGFIEDGYIVCPAHGWMFNLQTGRMPTNSKGLNCYPVLIIENELYIKVSNKDFKW